MNDWPAKCCETRKFIGHRATTIIIIIIAVIPNLLRNWRIKSNAGVMVVWQSTRPSFLSVGDRSPTSRQPPFHPAPTVRPFCFIISLQSVDDLMTCRNSRWTRKLLYTLTHIKYTGLFEKWQLSGFLYNYSIIHMSHCISLNQRRKLQWFWESCYGIITIKINRRLTIICRNHWLYRQHSFRQQFAILLAGKVRYSEDTAGDFLLHPTSIHINSCSHSCRWSNVNTVIFACASHSV